MTKTHNLEGGVVAGLGPVRGVTSLGDARWPTRNASLAHLDAFGHRGRPRGGEES